MMFLALLGLFPAILFSALVFLINPVIGVIWVLWLIGVAIYTLTRNSNGGGAMAFKPIILKCGRGRRRSSRRRGGVMCGPGGCSTRGKRFRMTR